MDVFKHAKIARWRLRNADSLKMLKANYMLHIEWLNMWVKFLFWNSKRLLRKLQKILGGYFFLPHPVDKCLLGSSCTHLQHHVYCWHQN